MAAEPWLRSPARWIGSFEERGEITDNQTRCQEIMWDVSRKCNAESAQTPCNVKTDGRGFGAALETFLTQKVEVLLAQEAMQDPG